MGSRLNFKPVSEEGGGGKGEEEDKEVKEEDASKVSCFKDFTRTP